MPHVVPGGNASPHRFVASAGGAPHSSCNRVHASAADSSQTHSWFWHSSFTVQLSGHVTSPRHASMTGPHSNVAQTCSAVVVHTHSLPEQVSPAPHVLGHVMLSPQSLTAGPHASSNRAHAVVMDSLHTHRPPEHVSFAWQDPQLTASPHAFCAGPHSMPSQASSADSLQTH